MTLIIREETELLLRNKPPLLKRGAEGKGMYVTLAGAT